MLSRPFFLHFRDMSETYEFESKRLGFRFWKPEDREPFSVMNANKLVMKYFPNTLNRNESDAFVERISNHFKNFGYGLWAVEIKSTNDFIGFIGFYTATFKSEFTPCIEIGWRLDQKFWNNGYATEGAKRCLEYGFKTLGFCRVYSFTSQINSQSINVMNKIGLSESRRFQHPNIDSNDPLCPHVLYTIDREGYGKFIE